MKNIKIINARTQDVPSMAKLIAENLGTCDLDCKTDVFEANVKHVLKMLRFYKVALDEQNELVGLCGIGPVTQNDDYGLNIGKHRDVLYVVVCQKYQRCGIGTKLLQSCLTAKRDEPILYEAWGEIENGDVHSHKMLQKCSFSLLKDLGTDFYKNHGYCARCVNKDKNCRACFCKIYIYKKEHGF